MLKVWYNIYNDREDLYAALGQTDAGRYLKAFFICKRNKDALVISTIRINLRENERRLSRF